MSPIRAVIFDLFGTLVGEFPIADWDAHLHELAGALGVDPVALRAVWEASSDERQTGRLGDIAANIREMCRRASDALYVGDGSYGQLRGARAVGMRAVLVRDPGEADGAYLRAEFEAWAGETIASIADVP